MVDTETAAVRAPVPPEGAVLLGPPAVTRPPQRVVSTYLTFAAEVRDAGLLERRRGYYWTRLGVVALALAALVVASALVGPSWWQLLLAPLLGMVLTQIAFLGHDAAHQQMFSSPRSNEGAARILASAGTGLSYGWWLGKHDAHHAAPNQRGRDTDIESKVLAFYPEAAHGRPRVQVWLLRHQGFWLFPLLLLEGFNLHVDSGLAMLRGRRRPRRWLDAVLVVVHWAVLVTLLSVLMSPGQGAAFVAVHLASLGVFLGGAFVLNHTGMPVLPPGTRVDFLHRQVLASRNVGGGRWVDLVMGGLNRQIEHHLFPSMPRPNLPLVQPMVREFCRRHDIEYTQTSFVGAYAAVVAHLNTVGIAARRQNSCPLAARFRT